MSPFAQSTVEFIFAMIAVMFLVYGTVQVFRWAGMDMAQRRWAHEAMFMNAQLNTEQQLAPDFYRPARMNVFPNVGSINAQK